MTELSPGHYEPETLAAIVEKFKSRFKSVDQGCATSLLAGLDDSLSPGNPKCRGAGVFARGSLDVISRFGIVPPALSRRH
ncbi:hypothetical protein FOPE_10931 [Fonsecaea pedrosoi]|nr:hypothetical protein FOPE_10931 [Fonsecaea pedrosoi]